MSTTTTYATPAPQTANAFADAHFQHVQLGHVARNRACLRVARLLCRHPSGTLPHKLANPNDYKAMDVLMNRPEVTHASILASHYQHTRTLMAQHHGPLLVLHDTTTLDYSGLGIPELGPIGNGGGRGYLCHNALVVDPATRAVLGLAHQILHHRVPTPANEGVAARRARPTRESRLWSTAVQALGPVAEGQHVLDVADRGADIFEFLATEQQLGRRCVVRSCYNRAILVGHEETGATTLLYDHLRTLPATGTLTKEVHDAKRDTTRVATLSVSFAAVQLRPPHVKKGEYPNVPLRLWGVRVWEAMPPAKSQRVEWFLLTFEPVTTFAEAQEVGRYYSCRIVVEEYHKGQKTGCNIEDLQFETEQALQPMIALLSVVAVLLLNLRIAARTPEATTHPATDLFDAEYEEVLRVWRYRTPRGVLTIREFFLALGRLGGHMNRKSDGLPGWLTLWRGWEKLQTMLDGAAAERRRQTNRRVT